jgi:hypothetical protein
MTFIASIAHWHEGAKGDVRSRDPGCWLSRPGGGGRPQEGPEAFELGGDPAESVQNELPANQNSIIV